MGHKVPTVVYPDHVDSPHVLRPVSLIFETMVFAGEAD